MRREESGVNCLTAAYAGQPREAYREPKTVSFLGGRFFIGDSRRKQFPTAMLPFPHAILLFAHPRQQRNRSNRLE